MKIYEILILVALVIIIIIIYLIWRILHLRLGGIETKGSASIQTGGGGIEVGEPIPPRPPWHEEPFPGMPYAPQSPKKIDRYVNLWFTRKPTDKSRLTRECVNAGIKFPTLAGL